MRKAQFKDMVFQESMYTKNPAKSGAVYTVRGVLLLFGHLLFESLYTFYNRLVINRLIDTKSGNFDVAGSYFSVFLFRH